MVAPTIYAEQYIYEDHPYNLISLFIKLVTTVFVEKLLALMKSAETAEKVLFIIIFRFKYEPKQITCLFLELVY